MKAKSFRVTTFKSIDDSTPVELQDVTCLVGKNESGKTALLQALARINPVGPIDPNFKQEDYPRKNFVNYKRLHEQHPAKVIHVTFELSPADVDDLQEAFGKGVVKTKAKTLILCRNYKNQLSYENFWDVFDEAAHVSWRISGAGISGDQAVALGKAKNLQELKTLAENATDPSESVKKLASELAKADQNTFSQAVMKSVSIPEFFYFDEYAALPGEIKLQELASRLKAHKDNSDNELRSSDYTAQALLSLAAVDISDIIRKDNYESVKANLEAASNHISDQIFKYWSQNRDLAVEFDLDPVLDGQNRQTDTILKIRIRNNRHRVTVPFDERSRGFVWFFSFLVAFSDHANREDNVVLLLDEPGLALHARAQGDLLRYIEEELAPQHQIVYSTHSPFMIDPHHLERVRTVEDVERDGTKVFDSPLRSDPDTVFPLQTALGYSLAQTLFLGPKCLLVEGPSDFVYLTIASEILLAEKRVGLPHDIVIVPVGGADKLCTFVSLLGANQLGVGVLMDISSGDKQRIEDLIRNEHLRRNRLFTYASFVGAKEADVEDLFRESDYVDLVRTSYSNGEMLELDLAKYKHPRITKRIEAAFKDASDGGQGFSHYRPAHKLMRDATIQKKLFSDDTLNRFEAIFKAISEAM